MQREAAGVSRPVEIVDPIAKVNQICKAVGLAALIAAGATALYLQLHRARFGGLLVPAVMEQAQVAAHIARGEGMTTGVVTPLGLRYSPSVRDHPDLANPPLYLHVLALAFRVRGPTDGTIAICNGLIYLMTIAAIYVLAKLMYGKGAAILATVLYATSMEALDRGLRGESTGLAGLLLTLALLVLYLVVRREWTPPATPETAGSENAAGRSVTGMWLGLIGAAVLLALAHLSGYTSLLLLVPLALMAWFGLRRHKTAAALVFILVALACLAPWFYYNHQRTGILLPPLLTCDLLRDTPSYPGSTVFRGVSEDIPDPVSFAITHPGQMGMKLLKKLAQFYRRVPLFISLALLPFFVVGAFLAKRSRENRAIWRVVIAAGVINLVMGCLATSPISTIAVLAPVATCLAAGAFMQLLGDSVRSRGARAGLTVLLVAVVAFPYAATISLGGRKPVLSSSLNLAKMRQALPKDAVIGTNDPWAVAWYTGRTAVWLPRDDKALAELRGQGVDIDYVYLSRVPLMYPDAARPDLWEMMLMQPDAERLGKLGKLGVLPGSEILIELAQEAS